MPVNTAVSDNFHIVISQQQINQHAIIMFCIPDIEMPEDVDRALPGRQASQNSIAGQAGLNHHTDFAGVMTRARSPPCLQKGHGPRSCPLVWRICKPSICATCSMDTRALRSWKSTKRVKRTSYVRINPLVIVSCGRRVKSVVQFCLPPCGYRVLLVNERTQPFETFRQANAGAPFSLPPIPMYARIPRGIVGPLALVPVVLTS